MIEHFRSQEERKLLKMRVSDLNQDVIKLKKFLRKYEEKYGKLDRKKQKGKNSNLNTSEENNTENTKEEKVLSNEEGELIKNHN